MPNITRELKSSTSPLRVAVDEHRDLLARWRQQLRAELRDSSTWVLPVNKRRASIVGTALDYRARWFLCGVDELAPTVTHAMRLCAESSATSLTAAFEDLHRLRLGPGLHDAAIERRLAELAAAAATVEPLMRAGPMVRCPLDEHGYDRFVVEYSDVVDDIVQLTHTLPLLFGDDIGRDIVPGVVVGTGNLGGDVDLVIDDVLVEIKCVSDPMSDLTKNLRQILIYAARTRATAASLVLPRQTTRTTFDLTGLEHTLNQLDNAIVAAYRPSFDLDAPAPEA